MRTKVKCLAAAFGPADALVRAVGIRGPRPHILRACGRPSRREDQNLKAEQAAQLLRLTRVVPDVEELRRPLIAALADLTAVLKSKPERAHALLAKLIAGKRLTVRTDPVRGYMVEGLLRLEIERDPQGLGPEDLARQVAGG